MLTWQYAAVTDDGREYLYGNEFRAFDKLNELNTPGRVEYRDGVAVTVRYIRGADGRWTQPPQPPSADEYVDDLMEEIP